MAEKHIVCINYARCQNVIPYSCGYHLCDRCVEINDWRLDLDHEKCYRHCEYSTCQNNRRRHEHAEIFLKQKCMAC